MKGKKAEENWVMEYLIWAIVIVVLLGLAGIFFVVFVSKQGSSQAELQGNIETFLLKQRLFKSQDCFVSSNQIRIIDVSKFSEERLNYCYLITDRTIPAFRLSLNSNGIDNLQIKTPNWSDIIPVSSKETKQVTLYSKGETKIGEIDRKSVV